MDSDNGPIEGAMGWKEEPMVALLTAKQSHLEVEPLESVLAVGCLVYVTCYGPCRGLKGIIQAVDVIAPADVPLCFYLVTLLEGQMKEPVWCICDDVAAVEGENVSLWRSSRKELSSLELEALEIVVNESLRAQNRSLKTLSTV
jgi:hypothetical protein